MNQKQKIDYSKIYSPSKLGMFEECPKEYYLYYLDPRYKKEKYRLMKRPENIWPFQTLGKAVHDAITLFYHQPPDQQSREVLLEGLEKTWRSEVAWKKEPPLGRAGGFESIEEERNSYREAQKIIKNFYKMKGSDWEIHYLPTKDFPNSIEDYKKLIRPLNEQFDISGKFDLVVKDDKGLHVIDFKTGKNEERDSFQLRFYKILAEENFGEPVSKASFFYLKSGEKGGKDMTEHDSSAIKDEILEKIKTISSTQKFEARPNSLCNYCLFRQICDKESSSFFEGSKSAKASTIPEDLPF